MNYERLLSKYKPVAKGEPSIHMERQLRQIMDAQAMYLEMYAAAFLRELGPEKAEAYRLTHTFHIIPDGNGPGRKILNSEWHFERTERQS